MSKGIFINKLQVYFQVDSGRELRYKSWPDLILKLVPSLMQQEYLAGRAIDEVTCEIPLGKVTGIVGRSGSGKSVLGKSIARIVQGKPGIVHGSIRFKEKDLLGGNLWEADEEEGILEEKARRADRLRLCDGLIEPTNKWPKFKPRKPRIGLIFQDPSEYLNPAMTLFDQLKQTIEVKGALKSDDLKDRIEQVLIESRFPQKLIARIKDLNHKELSGGLRQRFAFALARAADSELLIADEPVTDLDVMNAKYIIDLLHEERERGKTIILVSHDLHLIDELADLIYVIHEGRIIERFDNQPCMNGKEDLEEKWPVQHPYTISLIQSYVRLYDREEGGYLLKGLVPMEQKEGCRYTSCLLWHRYYPDCQLISQDASNTVVYCPLGKKDFGVLPNRSFLLKETESLSSPDILLFPGITEIERKHMVSYANEQEKKRKQKNPDRMTTKWLPLSPLAYESGKIPKEKCDERGKMILLEMRNLSAGYEAKKAPIVQGIQLELLRLLNREGNPVQAHLGIIGESGSGKTTLARAILRLLPVVKGLLNAELLRIRLPGNGGETNMVDLLLSLRDKKLQQQFRRHVQYIFQDCGQALHPKKTLERILGETADLSGQDEDYYEGIWSQLGLKMRDLNKRPGEMSGGMKRRAFIVRAFTALSKKKYHPKFMIIDEAVKGVDTVAQEEILAFFAEKASEQNINYINISHNLSLIRALSDVVYVMFGGRVIEVCDTEEFFEEINPMDGDRRPYLPSFFHPYSGWLKFFARETDKDLQEGKPGDPDPQRYEKMAKVNDYKGCPFYAHCPLEVTHTCFKRFPDFIPVKDNNIKGKRYHFVACHRVPERSKWQRF